MLLAFLISSMRATYPTNLILLDLIANSGKGYIFMEVCIGSCLLRPNIPLSIVFSNTILES
jgi:hypothetical protein